MIFVRLSDFCQPSVYGTLIQPQNWTISHLLFNIFNILQYWVLKSLNCEMNHTVPNVKKKMSCEI